MSTRYYQVHTFDWGFKIQPQSDTLQAVWVIMDRYGYMHVARDGHLEREPRFTNIECPVYQYPLYNFHAWLDRAIELLYEDWRPKVIRGKTWHEAPTWMFVRTRKHLAKGIKAHWQKMIAKHPDQELMQLHKQYYALSLGRGYGLWAFPTVFRNRERNRHLISDMVNMYAVRAKVLQNRFIPEDPDNALIEMYGDNLHMRKTMSQATGWGLPYYIITSLDRASDWLGEIIKTRTRALAYHAIVGKAVEDEKQAALGRSLLRSSDEDIKRAVEIAYDNSPYVLGGKPDWRRPKEILGVLGWIYDVVYHMEPEEIARCKITGLARRSVDYHRDTQRRYREQQLEWERRNAELLASETMLPPIDLPEAEGVTFLDTYKAVVDEGQLMGHCVGAYAKQAVDGRCFLFHIEYEGEMATAEVTWDGRLNQIHGPRNQYSPAEDYGRKVLREWIKDWPQELPQVALVHEYGEIPF